jgi:hypothetical protein
MNIFAACLLWTDVDWVLYLYQGGTLRERWTRDTPDIAKVQIASDAVFQTTNHYILTTEY